MKVCKMLPLFNCDKFKYSSIFYSGDKLFLFNKNHEKVSIYNLCLEEINCLKTCYVYTTAIKGNNGNLFLIRKNDWQNIYISNSCFEEFDKITLKVPKEYLGEILAIAYDKNKEKIYVATENTVYSVTIDGDFIKEELSHSAKYSISTSLLLNDSCHKASSNKYQYCGTFITGIGIFCNQLYIAYNKKNSAYIGIINSDGNITGEEYVDSNVDTNTFFVINNVMHLFVTKKGSYNYIYVTSLKCDKCSCDKKKDCSFICPKPRACSFEDSKCEIIKSIANIECSLSHILNAEGEKIQKVVKQIKDPDKILAINESVGKMIKNITFLEFLLSNKLEIVLNESNCK